MVFLDKYKVIYSSVLYNFTNSVLEENYLYLSHKKVVLTPNNWIALYFTSGFHLILAEIL